MLNIQKTADKLSKTVSNTKIKTIARFVLGFLLAMTKIGNMRPFGIAYALCSKKDELARCGGAFLGSLLTLQSGGVLYAAAIMISFSCRIVFKDTAVGKNKLFMPMCIALSVICVKGASVLPFSSFRGSVLLVCEAVFSAAVSGVFRAFVNQKRDILWFTGGAVLILASLMALEPLRAYSALSVARIFAVMAIICAGAFFGSAAGAGTGVIFGALFDIAAFSQPRLAFVYGLGGLLGGSGQSSPKALRCIMFAVGSLSAAFWYGGAKGSVGIIAECIIGAGVMCFVKYKAIFSTEEKMPVISVAKSFDSSSTQPVSEAVGYLANMVLHDESVGKNDGLNRALDRAADAVCSSCGMAKDCWSINYTVTRGAFDNVSRQIKGKKNITENDMPAPFASKCRKLPKLCNEINRQTAAVRVRESAKKKQQENSRLMKKQYDTMAMLLEDIGNGEGAREELLTSVHKKTLKIAQSYFGSSECSVRCLKDRLVIDILLPEIWESSDIPAASDSLSLALGCRLSRAVCVDSSNGKLLRFFANARIGACVDVLSVCREGEKVCGDCVRHLLTAGNKQIVVLSDGMGAGQAAKSLSSSAVDAAIRLAEAGASLPAAAEVLEPVLEAGFESSGFATLDMLEIDLLSGECTFVKYGAQPSYIIRGGKVQKVWKQSLPAGLGGKGEVLRCTLVQGDKIIMMTDGASLPDSFDMSGEELCREMTKGRAKDDMTAAVITVTEG